MRSADLRVGEVYAYKVDGWARPVIVRELMVEGRLDHTRAADLSHGRRGVFKPLARCRPAELHQRAVWWPRVQLAQAPTDSGEVYPLEVAPGVPADFYCDPKLLTRSWADQVVHIRHVREEAAALRERQARKREFLADAAARLTAAGVPCGVLRWYGLQVRDAQALVELLCRVLPADTTPSTPSTPSEENARG